MLHRLLQRQLKGTGLGDGATPPTAAQWREILERVSRTYSDADQDRYTLERSLTISSAEMEQLYDDMAGEKAVVDLIATGATLQEILTSLVRFIEERSKDVRASVLILDKEAGRLRHGAAPSLPQTYNEAVDGIEIGPAVGSCGTAAYIGAPVIVTDIASDPLWANAREVALEHGLRACWSTPIRSTGGDILGTFAMYYAAPRSPDTTDRRLVERATHVASIAIERSLSEEALRRQEATLRATIESIEEGIIVVNGGGRIEHFNARFAEMWNVTPDELRGASSARLLSLILEHLQDPGAFIERVGDLYRAPDKTVDTLRFKDGRIVERYSSPLPGGYAATGRIVGLRDVTERRKAAEELQERAVELERANQELTVAHEEVARSQAQLQEYATRLERMVQIEHEQAVTDALTGLANHRGAHRQLETIVQDALEGGSAVSLVMADIDNFKLFNDTYGHTCGDQIVKLVGDVFRRICRANRDIACRYGGDEFLLILPGKGRRAARNVANRISENLGQAEFRVESGKRIPISLSLGIASLPQDATTIEKLIASADAAMYEAKRARTHVLPGSSSVVDALTKDTTFGVLDSLVQSIDAKDRYTKRHSDVVAEYGMKLAAQLGLSEDAQRALRIAGLLHDLGKLAVPDELLKKPAELTPEEYEIVKRHVVIGEVLIREVPHVRDVIQAVSCHHERYDGTGYPRGLKGQEIPLLGRIIAIADAYSAMSLDRPYRKALSTERVFEELRAAAGTQLDPELVAVFIDLLLTETDQATRAA